MARILILGGGFGGTIAAERLSQRLGGGEHQLTLVSMSRDFTFYPGLVRLAFGHSKPEDLTFDLAAKLHEQNVRFVHGEE